MKVKGAVNDLWQRSSWQPPPVYSQNAVWAVQGAKPHAPKTATAIALECKRWFDGHAGVCVGQELHRDDQAQQLHQGTTTTVLGSARQVLELFEPRLVRQVSIALGGIQCILQDFT